MSSRNFMLKGIDLCDLVVMDAGTGAANTTLWLAKELKEAGGGRIISIHHNLKRFFGLFGKSQFCAIEELT